jgi:ADP-ribose pyrophosphatase YjhB (NUDIX family)
MDRRPSATVAAVIERDGRFLLVEEVDAGVLRFNQPAGHLEQHESLIEACRREVLEESAWHFEPRELVGIYRWHSPENGITYLRFAFCGKLGAHEPQRKLDEGIVRAAWLHPQEIRDSRERHRSPLVLRCMEDFLAGKRYPMELLNEHA